MKKKSSQLVIAEHRIRELHTVIAQLETEKAGWRAWQQRALRAEKRLSDVATNVSMLMQRLMEES